MDEELKQHLDGMEARIIERMRDMQTELLRGFRLLGLRMLDEFEGREGKGELD